MTSSIRIAAVATAVSAVLCAAQASAQSNNSGDDQAKIELEEVTVTGSRIKRAGFDTLEPATVISGDEVAERGLTNIADALNELPGFGAGVTPEGGQSGFGPGLNFVNRFGLGTNRTLTLINGRRFVSSNAATIFGPAAPGLQVDLNFIPSILLDSVENLTVGGAPTYGSDAIAGVVNVKLKQNFEGLSFFSQGSMTEREDGESYSYGGVWGTNFADGRGNVTVSAQRSETNGVLAVDRSRFADALLFGTNPTAAQAAAQGRPANDGRINPNVPLNGGPTDGIPNAVLIGDRRISQLTFNGLLFPATGATNLVDGRLRGFGTAGTNYLQFNTSGNLVSYNPGIPFGAIDASGGDGLNLVETAPLGADLERTTFTSSARWEFNENLEGFFEGYGYKAEALEIVDQTAFNATVFGADSAAIVFSATHPLLTQQARDTLAANSIPTFRLSRAHRDLTVNNARSETDIYQVVGGLRGDFEMFNRSWNWEGSANFGKNDSTFFSTQLNRQKFVNSLNVVTNAAGQVVCSTTPIAPVMVNGIGAVADPNCVPLDIFGEGRPSQAARAYVASLQQTDSELEQRVFNANIGSTLFDIWGGPIAFNVGYEYRKEMADFRPDDYLQQGLGRSAPIMSTRGQFSTDEFFGELLIPVVSEQNDIPGLNYVTLTAKGRRVDNTVNGKFTAWTTGLQWSPIRDIEIRGNVTRSLRAPALVELFAPVSPIFTAVADPCDSRNISGGTRPAVRAANCAQFLQQFGLPAGGFNSIAVSATTRGSTQGDPTLDNETANAWTGGVVFRPRFIKNFQLAIDYIDIRVDDIIANLNANNLATGCFDNSSFPNQFCDRFTRGAPGTADAGQILFVQTGFVNGDFQSTAGVAAELAYAKDLSDFGLSNWGVVDVALSYYGVREELQSTNSIVINNTERALTGAQNTTSKMQLTYTRGPIGIRYDLNYTDDAQFSRTFNADSQDFLSVPDYTTHDLSLSYTFRKDSAFRLAATNLADNKAPFPVVGGAFGGVYDVLGRRYSASLTYSFW
jgi:outer membrane receptor protein involved in Fe transport